MLIAISITLLSLTLASAKDDNKWVWGEGRRSRDDFQSRERPEASARYEIYEPNNNYPPYNNFNENRPLYSRPLRPGSGLVQRPGGVYGPNGPLNSGYGQAFYPGGNRPASGQGAPFDRDGPFKEFDYCKCSEKFNCESPGISYGQCDVGKKYCCYSRKPGGPLPSRPINSPENGVLVGPGGPRDPLPGFNPNRRPYPGTSGFTGGAGFNRPGAGGFGLGGRPDGYLGRPDGYLGRPDGLLERPEGFIGRPEPNTYSPENGILVGPGGPIDRPYQGQFGIGFRSRTEANKKNSS